MIGSFFAAILTTVILKNSIATESFLNDTLLPMFESMLGSEMFKTVEAMSAPESRTACSASRSASPVNKNEVSP